jgi:hypothetical protein
MFANGSETRVAIVPEVTWGTTPASPTFQTLRAAEVSMRSNKQTGISEELRADRNVTDEFMLGLGTSGNIRGELSYGTYDDLMAAALQGTWATNVLKNGVVDSYFTVEETLELGATDSFSRFVGCKVNTMGLTVNARAVIGINFGLMGKSETLGTAALSGATYTAANTKAIQTASSGVASLTVGGLSPTVRSISMNVNNNLFERPAVGSLYSAEFGDGSFDVTGDMEIYFENNTTYQAVLDHGGGAVEFTVGTVTAEKYTFRMGKIIFLNGERTPSRKNEDKMLRLPFRAVYSAADACSLMVTRAVA